MAVAFTLHVDWWQVAREAVMPHLPGGHAMLLMVVAVFGTTISPYLLSSLGILGTGMLAVPVLAGVGLCFMAMYPVKELSWPAVLNGVIAVPIMVVMMLLATRRDVLAMLVTS